MKHITLIVPAHNEGIQMEETARALLDSPLSRIADLIFVVDGCRETREAIGRAFPAAKIVFMGRTVGKGRAVWEGFLTSGSEYVGFLDADGPVSLRDAEKMCRKIIEENADCIIASRTKIRGRGAIRALSSRAFNLLVRSLFPLPFPDTQCGFKLFRKSVLGKGKPMVEGYAFDVEFLLRVLRNGGKIQTYEVESTERKGGSFSLLSSPRMLLDLLLLKLFS
ncbi:MAG: glycosyltransferase [Candidatus Micrarchaeota archaeon]